MQSRKLTFVLIAAGLLVVLATGVWLATAQTVHAQCGSQASSCKNCHEVQAKDPVNNDGTSWHQAHAFGDFCYICHGGNQTATDETAAHAAMVAPLSDPKAACQQCHPSDYQSLAQGYADKLGVSLGASGAQPSASPANATPGTAVNPTSTPQPAAAAPQATLSPNDPNLVNYVQRYDAQVLGQSPTNWGNVILLIMIAALLIGGGGLVVSREGLIRVSFRETKAVEGEFPADVVDMVPQLAKLKPNARKSLSRLLEKPDATADVLTSLDHLTESKNSDQKE